MPERVTTDSTDQLGVQRLLDIVRAINNLSDALTAGFAPVDAPLVTFTADATLTSSRVLTDSTTIDFTTAVAGQVSASVIQSFNYAWTGTQTWSIAPRPSANDAAALGISGTAWSDLFLADGGIINWNAGALTITGTTSFVTLSSTGGMVIIADSTAATNRMLQFNTSGVSRWKFFANATAEAGADAGSNLSLNCYSDAGVLIATPLSVTRSTGVVAAGIGITPDANDGAYLGTLALGWSDLFLAEGGVINWDNSDQTITQTSDTLAFAGGTVYSFATGELRVGGDVGGAASTNTITGTSDITSNSTGVGTILFKGTTSRNSTGFIKIYIGTTAYYIPVFATITG